LTDEAKEFLIFKGYNPDYGARPLRRAIENLIENPLSEEILRNAFKGKDLVNITVTGQDENKRLNFEATTKREQEELQASLVAVGSESESSPSAATGA
jgi:ATP-dependent Clp protease ATP-binding subunit ClpC